MVYRIYFWKFNFWKGGTTMDSRAFVAAGIFVISLIAVLKMNGEEIKEVSIRVVDACVNHHYAELSE